LHVGVILCDLLQILSNFGVDVLEALSSTCTLFTRHSIGLGPLVSDLLVAFLLITAHGSVLMCQVRLAAVLMLCCFCAVVVLAQVNDCTQAPAAAHTCDA
jgi:hypothetical protein